MTSVSFDGQQLLGTFYKALDQAMAAVEQADTFEEYESALGSGATTLAEAITHVGNESATYLSELSPKVTDAAILPAGILSYIWTEEAKSFLLLWRDVLLQQQKAKIMQMDGQVTKGALYTLRTNSKKVLQQAAAELESCFNSEMKALSAPTKANSKYIGQWRIQHNPWSVYQEQIGQIAAQCREAEIQQNGLQNTTTGFIDIQSLIRETIQTCQDELKQIKLLSQQTIDYIEESIENKPGTVASYLEELENKVNIPNHLDAFTQSLTEKIENLATKMNIPIDTNGGIVQFKEANFTKNARQWLDSEILPILYEIWELTERAEYSVKMAIVNIRNRAVLLSNERKEGTEVQFRKDYYSQPLEGLIKKIDTWSEDITRLEKIAENRLEASFQVSAIYDAEETFLPVSLQSTLSQFTIGQNKVLQRVRTQLSKPTSFIRQFRDTVSEEETLSTSEKIVRTIQDRSVDPLNAQYTSIFQTKGYIGESFWVGREQELQRIATLVEQWEMGYRGAALITGERLSGKSLFGEIIANKYFPKKIIRLTPNTNMRTEGRKWTTSYDLKEALTFIKTHAQHSRSLIWIDNLEIWQSPNVLLGQNVRHLLEHIDNHATQFFYIVSMNKWLKDHLKRTSAIHKSFQATVFLDKMSMEEIQQAILIRHGATHKILVDEKGEEVSSEGFNKMTAAIYRSSQKTIGDALNRWAASMHKVDDERVIHKELADYSLPDFLNPNAAILLASILRQKQTNEYHLRRLFGVAFKEKYSSILQRLLNMGVLKRELNGMLQVNTKIVNELGRLLERKKYL